MCIKPRKLQEMHICNGGRELVRQRVVGIRQQLVGIKQRLVGIKQWLGRWLGVCERQQLHKRQPFGKTRKREQ